MPIKSGSSKPEKFVVMRQLQGKAATGSAQKGGDPEQAKTGKRGWEPRPLLAHAVRIGLIVLPFIAGWLAIRLLQDFFITSDSRPIAIVAWLVQAVVAAGIVSAATAAALNRFTPLSSLLNMTLVFPDAVPSRFGLALRSSGVKKLLAQPQIRLSSSAQEAAEQAVQLVTHLARHEPMTRGHTERVRAYADVIGQQMGLSADELNGLRWGALLHDVGKLTVPADILNKPGKPTSEEWDILRGHPGAAVEILEPLKDWLGDWLLAAPQHHERFDGSGYPLGLSGHDISLAGRIVAVADAYDVITSKRSYKEPKSAEWAREEMVRSAGSHFDPVVVRSLLEAGIKAPAGAGRFGWILELPGVAQIATSGGQLVSTAVVAVAAAAGVTAVETVPVEPAPVEALAFEAEDSEPEEVPELVATTTTTIQLIDDSQVPLAGAEEPARTPTTAAPVDVESATTTTIAPTISTTTTTATGTGTAAPATTTTAPTSTAAPTTTAAPTSTAAPTTTAAPATTAAPTTTTTTTPTTTTTIPTRQASTPDCALALQGVRDLLNADLRNCNLSELDLPGMILTGADLRGANLRNATLTDFNFTEVRLDGADLTGATLERGSAYKGSFVNVQANGSTIKNMNFFEADLTRAKFRNATFNDASMASAILTNTDFTSSTFTLSNMNDTTLASTNLTAAQLVGHEFFNSNVQGLVLTNANVSMARFDNTTGTPTGLTGTTFGGTVCADGLARDTSCW